MGCAHVVGWGRGAYIRGEASNLEFPL